ncbi:hypothetical protein [Saccharothrix sp. ALI-22-I]|uniref:hypothetical protein n=1 Tax=Saccharothrix sp. ALI-22-I TaxID=1933778 RepID=UPI000A0642CE|nr:hypothetical protein [Saccharothrix sp. ALI-22-I]
MDVILAGLAIHLVGLLVRWLRLRWQVHIERQRGEATVQTATRLRGIGGTLREQRADGSVTELIAGTADGR